MRKNKTKDNAKVVCPVDDCMKVFDNRDRFVDHVTDNHKMKDLTPDENSMDELDATEV